MSREARPRPAAAGRLAAGGYPVVCDGVIGPWFLETLGAAAGLDTRHYVILLPLERLGRERVRDRAGHGFRDREAARHMYAGFAEAGSITGTPWTALTTQPRLGHGEQFAGRIGRGEGVGHRVPRPGPET